MDILHHIRVQWARRDKVPSHYISLGDDMFLGKEGNQTPEFEDKQWSYDLASLTNMLGYLSMPNKSLRVRTHVILDKVSAFFALQENLRSLCRLSLKT